MTNERKKLALDISTQDAVVLLSEGNPGALNVIIEMLGMGTMGHLGLFHLDDMNIRGPQIWVAYKDFCDGDIDRLIEAARERDPEMIKKVNSMCPEHTAVVGR